MKSKNETNLYAKNALSYERSAQTIIDHFLPDLLYFVVLRTRTFQINQIIC